MVTKKGKKDIKRSAVKHSSKAKQTPAKANAVKAEKLVLNKATAAPAVETVVKMKRVKLNDLLTLRIDTQDLNFLIDYAKQNAMSGAATIARKVILDWVSAQRAINV